MPDPVPPPPGVWTVNGPAEALPQAGQAIATPSAAPTYTPQTIQPPEVVAGLASAAEIKAPSIIGINTPEQPAAGAPLAPSGIPAPITGGAESGLPPGMQLPNYPIRLGGDNGLPPQAAPAAELGGQAVQNIQVPELHLSALPGGMAVDQNASANLPTTPGFLSTASAEPIASTAVAPFPLNPEGQAAVTVTPEVPTAPNLTSLEHHLIENWKNLSAIEIVQNFNELLTNLRVGGKALDPATEEAITRACTGALLAKTGFQPESNLEKKWD